MSSSVTTDPQGQLLNGHQSQKKTNYKWIALSNTTLGILMVMINSSIILIALPNIFRGIQLNPLIPANSGYLLWMLMGFLVVTAVLVVSFGRIGDMFGRTKMYNLGFAVFTLFSILLSISWMHGSSGALYLIVMRILQGVGGALLFANSSAIITDAFPENERGLALGINNIAAIAGSFLGLILGGVLGPLNWHLVFLVSVPFGLFGTIWAYWKLEEKGHPVPSSIDWWGNLTFAVGLIAFLVGITYGIMPYANQTMGWSNPLVITCLAGGIIFLGIFSYIETKVSNPMFNLSLFKIRAFSAGNIASLLAALGRGGMMFILIIWLQGIWLPLHGYSFSNTPLWAGIYMLPMTVGFLIAGPVSGYLSDHFGARPFATGGMILAALSFFLLEVIPINFDYTWFGLLLLLNGLAMGLFASPNRAGIMNSLPPDQRGAGAGMVATFQNSSMVLSIGIFFTLIILGLSSQLPHSLYTGLTSQGVPAPMAKKISTLPPTGTLFAALLGYDPMRNFLMPILGHMPPKQASYLIGRSFFPKLISYPFSKGLHEAFDFAIAASLIAAVASWLRGGKYIHQEVPILASNSGKVVGNPRVAQPIFASSGQNGLGGLSRQNGYSTNSIPANSNGSKAQGKNIGAIGQIINPIGKPIGGAILTLSTLDGHQVLRASTHNDGSYQLDGIDSGSYVAVAAAPGFLPTATTVSIRSDKPIEQNFILEGVTSTSGMIRSAANSQGIAGAVVNVIDQDGFVVAEAITTSQDGTFSLNGLSNGQYIVSATAPGFLPAATTFTVENSKTSAIDLVLETGGSLTGKVISPTKTGVAGMAISAIDQQGQVVASGISQQDGSYSFSGLMPGSYTVVAAGFGPVAKNVELEIGQQVQLGLELE